MKDYRKCCGTCKEGQTIDKVEEKPLLEKYLMPSPGKEEVVKKNGGKKCNCSMEIA